MTARRRFAAALLTAAAVFGAVLSAPSAVDAQQSFTLEQLRELAVEHNPTLSQVRSRIEAAEATARQAGMWPNIHLGYANETVNGHQSDAVLIRQLLPVSGRLGADRAMHERDAEVGRLALEKQRTRVLNAVSMLYRSLLISAERVALQEEGVELLEEELATINQLANVGLKDRTDVLETEMALQHARLDLNEDRLEHRHHQREMALVVGDPDLGEVSVTGDAMELPGEFDYEAGLASLLDNSPELLVVDAELNRHAAVVRSEQVEARPDVMLTFGQRYNRGVIGRGHTEPVPPEWEVVIDVDLSPPLWNRNQHGVRAAQAEMAETEENLRRKRLELEETFDDEYHSYVVERDEARVFRDELLTRAEEVYALELGRYEDFGEAYGEVLEARGMVLDVRHKVLESLEAAWHKHILLEGFLLAGGLAHPDLHMLLRDKATTLNQ